MKPKLAVVRGNFFTYDEMKFYEPLKDEFDVTFFSSVKGTAKSEENFRVVETKSFGNLFNSLTGGLYRKISGIVSNVTGVDPEYVLELKKTLAGFDIVFTIDYNYLLTYHLANLKDELGFKLAAIHWDNIPFARDQKPLCKFMKYRVYNKIDIFCAMSERAKAALILEGGNESKIIVTGWGVDTEKFVPDAESGKSWRRKFGIGLDELVILFVGRVRASKGILELIYATKRLVMDSDLKERKIRVVIAGRGPNENYISNLTRRLNLERTILRIGFVPHEEIHNVHNMADIFCLPSIPRKYWQEQLGMVFLEAMACGKPVVTTFSGSIPEIIGDAGILVQPNDHLSLYEKLKELLLDPKTRDALGMKAIERVQSNFTTLEISKRIRKALTECTSESNVREIQESARD